MIFGVVLLVNYFRHSSSIGAYRSASLCRSPADALNSQTCRFEGQVKVLSSTKSDQLHAVVAFDSIPGHIFNVTFPRFGEPPGGLPAGETASATLWSGRVTVLSGLSTTDDPEDASPRSDLILSPFFGLIGLVGLFVSVRLARIAWAPS